MSQLKKHETAAALSKNWKHKKVTKIIYYTTVVDRLLMVSWIELLPNWRGLPATALQLKTA